MNHTARFLERIVRWIARQVPLYIEEQTDREHIIELIRSLRPIHSGFDLIRIGPYGDGGYLVPNDLVDIEYCFSPGVADITGFEEDLYSHGISSFLADYSVSLQDETQKKFIFDKKYIGSWNDDIYLSMDSWVRSRLPNRYGDLILQMDVEGAEYEVLFNMTDELVSRFRIMIIEFHYLSKLFDKRYFSIVSRVFEKLEKYFYVVHIHPNNYAPIDTRDGISIPPIMEVTFHRKDRVKNRRSRTDFPHDLDDDNTSNEPIVLPEIWFKN